MYHQHVTDRVRFFERSVAEGGENYEERWLSVSSVSESEILEMGLENEPPVLLTLNDGPSSNQVLYGLSVADAELLVGKLQEAVAVAKS